jgi:hypothetical protein
MSELVVETLELVNVGHDDGHARAIAAGALDLLKDAQLKEAPVEDASQAVKIGQLFYPLHIVRVLDRSGTDVGHRFQTLQFALAERVAVGAFQRQHSQDLPERHQRDAHARGRLNKEPHALGLAGQIFLDQRAAGGEDMHPGLAIGRKPPAFRNSRCERSMVRPQHQFVLFAEKQRNVRYLERLLDQQANLRQQFPQVENRGALLRDRVDGFQLPRPLPLQRIQARVLQRHGGLRRE